MRHTVVMGSRRAVGTAPPDGHDGLPARIAFLAAKARFQIEFALCRTAVTRVSYSCGLCGVGPRLFHMRSTLQCEGDHVAPLQNAAQRIGRLGNFVIAYTLLAITLLLLVLRGLLRLALIRAKPREHQL